MLLPQTPRIMSRRGSSTDDHSKFGIRVEVGNPLSLGTQEQRVASFIEVINLQLWEFSLSPQPLITPHVFTFSTTNKDMFNKMKRLVEKFQSRTAMAFTGVSYSQLKFLSRLALFKKLEAVASHVRSTWKHFNIASSWAETAPPT